MKAIIKLPTKTFGFGQFPKQKKGEILGWKVQPKPKRSPSALAGYELKAIKNGDSNIKRFSILNSFLGSYSNLGSVSYTVSPLKATLKLMSKLMSKIVSRAEFKRSSHEVTPSRLNDDAQSVEKVLAHPSTLCKACLFFQKYKILEHEEPLGWCSVFQRNKLGYTHSCYRFVSKFAPKPKKGLLSRSHLRLKRQKGVIRR
jgi:hypothetical protein